MQQMTADGLVVVYSPSRLGGVRQVTESLARGIQQCGRRVMLVRSLQGVLRARFSHGASVAILSLETGPCSSLFRRSVYILHGFPVVDSYSRSRRLAVRLAARAARLGGAKIVAVSHLTRAVHERLYGIKVDAVVFNGCSDSFNDRARRKDSNTPRKRYVAYVGRLIDGKGLRNIVHAFHGSQLPSLGYVLKVAGAGPLDEWVKGKAREWPDIEHLGEITEGGKEDLLFGAEAFVSLNDFEPMGVVFVEALVAGCKLVAPFCGGHREFIPPGFPLAL